MARVRLRTIVSSGDRGAAGWAGGYYGIPEQSTLDAIRLLGRLEGIILDPVYEGKSMAGLSD